MSNQNNSQKNGKPNRNQYGIKRFFDEVADGRRREDKRKKKATISCLGGVSHV